MGAWGAGAFENDTACDWAYQLETSEDLDLVRTTLGRVIAVGGGYLDADIACEALAASEVVARLRGPGGVRDAYTETVDAWVRAHAAAPPAEIVALALAAIDRVLAAPSELAELWDEGEGTEWRDAVAELRSRIARA